MKFKTQNKPESLIFYILILVIIPALLYFKVVNFGLSGLDDSSIIYNINNTSGSKINIIGALTHDALMGNKGDTFYRPMQVISLMIDAGISGTQPWIYHFSNLLLHILTVIALFSFLCNIGIKKNISFLISLLFSVNPMISNAVAWIPARGDLLLCLFSLLSFITFLEYSKKKNPVYICLHFVAFLLALLSKETAVLLPFLIITYLILVQQKKITVNEIKPFLSVWLISYVLFFALRYIVLKISHPSNELGFIPLFKNLPVIPITFGKFFIPSNLTTLPFFDNTALITGVIVFLVILGSAIKFAWPKKHLLLWGAIWFFAFSIPPMLFRTYFAEIGYEYFDYRIYLPSVGILIMTGIIIEDLSSFISLRKMVMILVPIILVYSVITFVHLHEFTDPISFFTSAIKANPKNVLAYGERGTGYNNIGNNEKAMSDFDKAIKINPGYSTPYFNKGVLYAASGDHLNAEYYFSLALNADTLNHEIRLLKGNAYLNLSNEKLNLYKFNEDIVLIKKGIREYPEYAGLHNNLGLAYYYTLKFDSALFEYTLAIDLDKNSAKFYNSRGMARYHLNDFIGALSDFDMTLELKPDFLDALGNRGMVKIKTNDFEGAVSDLTKAVNLNPSAAAAYYFRGIAFMSLKKTNEAKNDWQQALNLGYKKAEEKLNSAGEK